MTHNKRPSFQTAEFRFACPVYIPASYHFEPHSHQHNELVLVQRGRLRAQVSGVEHIACPGDILIYPAGTLHEEWAEDAAPVLTWACAFYWDGFERGHPVFCRDAHGRVQELVAWLVGEHYAHSPSWTKDREYGLALLRAILAELKRLAAHEPLAMVEQVRAFIRDNIKEPFTLEDLIRISGLSKSHLARQYRAITGRTPMEDARFLRVEEARRLILSTSLPLCEIAPQVGIPDECRLSRLLKSLLGVGVRDLRPPGR